MWYILTKDGRPAFCGDVEVYTLWLEELGGGKVMQTQRGLYWVSTVFLGLDHSFGGLDPIVFETMVFPSKLAQQVFRRSAFDELDCERYSTLQEAIEGHKRICKQYLVFFGLMPPKLRRAYLWLLDGFLYMLVIIAAFLLRLLGKRKHERKDIDGR